MLTSKVTPEDATSQPSISINPPFFHTSISTDMERILKKTVFGIAYAQLHNVDPKRFRKKKPSGTDPHFSLRVNFTGENVQGDGGPYRQFFSDIAHELQSGVLPFFVTCPNAVTGASQNRDKYILAPSRCRSLSDLRMLRFLGSLMGMALRTNVLLPLDLPAFFWKPILGEQIEMADLEEIDESIRGLQVLRMSTEEMWGGEETRAFYETFECTLGDGTRIPLVAGGSGVNVTYETRLEYCNLVERARLNESIAGAAAISEGLRCVVPCALLPMYSWEELSWKICGKPHIDVDLLRRHTKYGNVPVGGPRLTGGTSAAAR
jgi:hypothetical protein